MKYYRVICSRCKKVICTIMGRDVLSAPYLNYRYLYDKCYTSHSCIDKGGVVNVIYREIGK